VSVELP